MKGLSLARLLCNDSVKTTLRKRFSAKNIVHTDHVTGRSAPALRFLMKPEPYGRIVFGASAILFGVIALMWHDADTWQALHRILSLPFGATAGAALMIAQIAGGLGIVHPRTARPGSIVLIVVYAIFSLTCVPGIIAAPHAYEQYGSFFEQFCPFCGALAVYAVTAKNAKQTAAAGQWARVGLGFCAISFALAQIFYFRFTSELVPTWIPPNQSFWATLTTIAFALAAIAILTDRHARLAIRLMALMLALFGALVWIPRLIAQPQAHLNWSEFALTLLIAGATAVVADRRSSMHR